MVGQAASRRPRRRRHRSGECAGFRVVGARQTGEAGAAEDAEDGQADADGLRTEAPSFGGHACGVLREVPNRKSTRLNSSHMSISYAVFCLKKKNKKKVLG